MAGVSLGGMSSGLDTQSIIDQLMAIERQPETRLKLRESALDARQSALSDVGSRLRNLLSAAKDLGSVTTWTDTQTLDVSDTSKVGATRLSGAAPGGHTINVTTLARSEQRSYSFQKGAATLDIGGTPITLTADDDGQVAADKINAASSPYYAVWVKDPLGGTDDRLVLTRKQTGSTGVPPLDVSGTNLTQIGATQAGVDAEFSVDGADPPQKSNSNVVTSAIPGLQLTLKATGLTSVSVSPPGPNNDAVKNKVQAFVDQYNSTVDFIRGKLTEKRVPNATNDSDARKGALFADTQLTGMLASLRNLVSDKTALGGAITSFGDIGVSTGDGAGGKSSADAIAGKLTLDATKLTEALQSHRTDVKTLLTDTTKGLATKLTNLLEPVGRLDSGLIDQRAAQAGKESSSIEDQIRLIEDRLTEKADRLKAQFAAMEQALAQSQSQGSWLAAQLG